MLSYGAHCDISGSGTPLLVIHDILGPELDYSTFPAVFNKHFHLYQITLPGYSKEDSVFKATPGKYAQWLQDLVNKFQLKNYHCLGLGMGGGIALQLATMDSVNMQKLVVLHPWQIYRPCHVPTYIYFKQVFQMQLKRRSVFSQWMNRFSKAFHPSVQPSAEFIDLMGRIITNPARQKQIQALLPTMILKNKSMRQNLHCIQKPVKIIWGTYDPWITKKAGEYLESQLQTVENSVIPDCGYWCLVEKPENVSQRIIQFLQAS